MRFHIWGIYRFVQAPRDSTTDFFFLHSPLRFVLLLHHSKKKCTPAALEFSNYFAGNTTNLYTRNMFSFTLFMSLLLTHSGALCSIRLLFTSKHLSVSVRLFVFPLAVIMKKGSRKLSTFATPHTNHSMTLKHTQPCNQRAPLAFSKYKLHLIIIQHNRRTKCSKEKIVNGHFIFVSFTIHGHSYLCKVCAQTKASFLDRATEQFDSIISREKNCNFSSE